MSNTIRAIALVGFYHGEPLIEPGQVVDLSPRDFAELKGYGKVDHAPEAPAVQAPAPTPKAAKARAAAAE